MQKHLFVLVSVALVCAHAAAQDGEPAGCDELVAQLSFEENLSNTGTRALAVGEAANAKLNVLSANYVDGKFGKALHFEEPASTTDADGKEVRSAAGAVVDYYEGLRMLGDTTWQVVENEDGTTTIKPYGGGTAKAFSDNEGSFTVSLWFRSTSEELKSGTRSAYLFHKGTWVADPENGANGILWVGIEFRNGSLYYVNKASSKKGENQIGGSGVTGTNPELGFDAVPVNIDADYLFDGNWHNVVVYRDHANGNVGAYVDALEIFTKDFDTDKCRPYTFGSKHGFTVGNSQTLDTNNEPFTGDIDEVRVYHGACTYAQVKELFENKALTLSAKTVEYDRDDYVTGYTEAKDGDKEVVSSALCQVTAAEVAGVEYYTLGGQKISAPARGLNVVRYALTDGSVRSEIVVVK